MLPVMRQSRSRATRAHASGSAYAAAVLADSPIAYWRLGESSGTVANDSSGNGHNGTYNGSPTLGVSPGAITGDSDTAVTFNGSTQYVAGPSLGLATNLSPLTYTLWFKTTSAAVNVWPFAEGNSTDNTPLSGFALSNSASNKLDWFIRSSANFITVTSLSAVNDGNWHMAAGTVDASLKMWLYIDGVKQNTVGGGLVADTVTFNTSSIAALTRGGVGNFFPGTLDEVAVFNYALTSTQISNLYAAGI